MCLKNLHTLVTKVSNSDLGLEPLTCRAIWIINKLVYQCTNLKFEVYGVIMNDFCLLIVKEEYRSNSQQRRKLT